jgi:hypothetical protein
MDKQFITMVNRQTIEEESDALANDELRTKRGQEADPLRPLVLVLLQQARRMVAEREAKKLERAARRARRRGGEVA